jgi:hypothetical protein
MRSAAVATLLVISVGAWLATVWVAAPTYLYVHAPTGNIAALADAMSRGETPGHDRGEGMLATLYFPPFPAAVSALRRAGLSWKGALRVASMTAALALLAAVAISARAASRNRQAAALAVALLASSFFFHAASLAARTDILAAAFALAALAAWIADPKAHGWRLPLFAALAWLTKATSCAVPIGLLLWAVTRGEWKIALRFGSRLALLLLAGVALSIPIGGPVWFMDTLRVILFAPPNQSFAIRGPAEILRYVGTHAEFAAACALALALLAQRRAGLTPLRWSAGASLAVALVVMSNRGSDYNHLLELQAIACVAAGILIAESLAPARARDGVTQESGSDAPQIEGAWRSLPALLGALVIVAASWRDLHAIGRQARDPAERRVEIVAAIRAEPGRVLTEDPMLTLLAGRPPAISEPALLRALLRRRDPRALRILDGARRSEWGLVVLNDDLAAAADGWYRDFHLGPEMVKALRANYTPSGKVGEFFLYRPEGDSAVRK